MKYVATINLTEQVSPDDWALNAYHKEIDGATQFSEIIDWAYSKFSEHERKREKFQLPAITIRPLE
jgi:hypothetical protein